MSSGKDHELLEQVADEDSTSNSNSDSLRRRRNDGRGDGSAVASSRQQQREDPGLVAARRMYYAGFLFLPWMWLVCFLTFRERVFKREGSGGTPVDPELKKYVWRSWAFSITSFAVVVVWIIMFQTSWKNWGDFGKSLLVINIDVDNW